MFCENCGTKLENNEKVCKSCETKYKEGYNLKISRPGKIMGFAVKLHITVDDTEFDLAANDEKTLNLSEGIHTVKYNIWCRREHEVNVKIEKDKICEVIFKYDALWGGFKISKKSIL